MKGRNIVITILSVAFIAVVGLCGLTAYSGYRWVQASGLKVEGFRNENFPAEVTETRAFDVTGPVELNVDDSFGAVVVLAEDGTKQVSVEIVKKAWGANEAEARKLAQELPVELSQQGNAITIRYEDQPRKKITFMGNNRNPNVNFTIKVPVETAVVLKSSFGGVRLEGTKGRAEIHSAFGEVTVTNVQGALSVDGTNGAVTVRDILAGSGAIALRASFGKITAQNLSAGKIEIKDQNGDVELNGLEASVLNGLEDSGDIIVENAFSAITLKGVKAASLGISGQNGDLILENGQISQPLKLQSAFGKIVVTNVDAPGYTLKGENGSIDLNGARGLLDLSNSFSDITVKNAKDATLKLKANNGKISFSGSLDPKAEHSVENSFGGVTLTLPTESAFQVSFEANFGKVKSDLPVTLAGEMSEGKLQGKLNAGGPTLTVKVENGDIVVKELK